jgi:mono/diheme cytochrome c family protein
VGKKHLSRNNLWRGAAACLLALLSACTVRQLGASDASLEQAKSTAAAGAALFEGQCAQCHGSRGEGRGGAPAVMGAGALPRYPREDTLAQSGYVGRDGQPGATRPPGPVAGRPEFVTAENLQAYLAYHMPKVKQQPLTQEDYWDIVQFMLIAHGCEVPPQGISEDNAAKIAVQAR